MSNFNPVEILKSEFHKQFNEPIDMAIILPSKYDDLYSLINVLYAQNDMKRAIIACIKILQKFPHRTEIFYVISLMFENDPLSYIFFKSYAKYSRDIQILKEAYEKSKSVNLEDSLYFIKKIEKKESTHCVLKEKIWVLDTLYQNTNDRSFYTRGVFARVEEMKYVGLGDILQYESELGVQGIKRAIRIIYGILKNKMDEEYLKGFLVTCFNYGEYEIFLDLSDKGAVDLESRLRVLISMEEIGIKEDKADFNNIIWFDVKISEERCFSDSANNNNIVFIPNDGLFNDENALMNSCDAFTTTFGLIKKDFNENTIKVNEILETYTEYMVNNTRFILDHISNSSVPIISFLKERETYQDIIDIHFMLVNVLLKKKKFEKIRIVLNNIISRLGIFNSKIEDLNISQIESYRLSGTFHEISLKFKTLFSLSLYFKETNRTEKAIALLTFLNLYDEGNDEIKMALNEVYLIKGEDDNALIFEQICRKKKRFKLTSDNVIKIRNKFNKLYKFYEENINDPDKLAIFLQESTFLLKDFFNNEYVFKEYEVKKPDRREMRRKKRKRIYFRDLDLTDGKVYSKKERRLLYREFRDLHGLTFDEWCFLIKINIYAYLTMNDYKKAIEIVKNFASGNFRLKHLKKYANKANKIGMIGLKQTLLYGDFENFIQIVNKMTCLPFNLLNFFCHYFPNYHEYQSYKVHKRNFIRFLVRKDDELIALFKISDQKVCKDEKVEYTENELPMLLPEDMRSYFLSTLYPRFLHKRTVNILLNLTTKKYEDKMAVAIMLLNHSTSKKEKLADIYAKRGFEILFSIEDGNKFIIYYNIARSYHLYGVLGWAEYFYKKALQGIEVRQYALTNLLIIYKQRGLDDLYFEYEKLFFDEEIS